MRPSVAARRRGARRAGEGEIDETAVGVVPGAARADRPRDRHRLPGANAASRQRADASPGAADAAAKQHGSGHGEEQRGSPIQKSRDSLEPRPRRAPPQRAPAPPPRTRATAHRQRDYQGAGASWRAPSSRRITDAYRPFTGTYPRPAQWARSSDSDRRRSPFRPAPFMRRRAFFLLTRRLQPFAALAFGARRRRPRRRRAGER